MMILKKKKTKMDNEYTTTKRNPDYTLGIYLTSIKVEQYRQVDDNRREYE